MARREVPTRVVPGDFFAGLGVASIVVPQAIAYAALAGLPPTAGLLAAVAAPVAAAFFASSPYLATGPVAITSLLTLAGLSSVAEPGTSEYVALAALLAVFVGVIRLGLGVGGGGVLAYLMSQPVLAGFTAGAGLLILLSQLPAALGVSADSSNPVRAAVDALAEPSAWNTSALVFAVVATAAVLLSRRVPATFPVVLVVVALAIVVAGATGEGGPTVGAVTIEGVPSPLDLPWGDSLRLLVPAVVIALVGFAEPAAICRKLAAEDRQNWSADRELVSQGVANVAAGLAGGYPVGGSFSRSTLNRLAGARTRWSGLVSGVAVLAFLPFASVLENLPRSVLAGVVIAAVVKLVDPRPVLAFWRLSKLQFGIAVTTFTAALVLAPRIDVAVLLGIGLAVLIHLWRELHLRVPGSFDGGELHVRPSGVLYFASAPGLEDEVNELLAQHPETHRLLVHLDHLGRMDVTGALALKNMLAEVRQAGLVAEVCGVPQPLRRIVSRLLLDDLAPECRAQLSRTRDAPAP